MMTVILESPYAGDIERNLAYARAAARNLLLNGYAPIASHLLYTQPGILDDNLPEERAIGIEAGLRWGWHASRAMFYTDLGWSPGMLAAKQRHLNEHGEHFVVERSLPGWLERWEAQRAAS